MDTADAAELIQEMREENAEDERFRSAAALLIAVIAGLLAVCSLGGGNVGEDVLDNNIKASDTWSFYQAKNVRQTQYKLALDALELQLAGAGGSMSPAARQAVEEKIADYRATIARYDSEPDPKAPNDTLAGEGKKQLSARGRHYQALRDQGQEQDASFDYAEVLYQIAIVLGSVAILATSRPVLAFSGILAAVATVFMVNGFFLLFHLPW